MIRRLAVLLLPLLATLPLGGCAGYRLVRPSEIEIPSYEARDVPVPAECEELIRRAAELKMITLPEWEQKQVPFCQQQQLVRAQEEEAAAARLEAHAAAANFALRVAVVSVGALVAVLAWVF